jgi:hypothetical protein
MTNKQAFIIGISFIIGLIIHGFIVQEKYQLFDDGKGLSKINTRTGDTYLFMRESEKVWLKKQDWHLLPVKIEEPKAEQ